MVRFICPFAIYLHFPDFLGRFTDATGVEVAGRMPGRLQSGSGK